MKVVDHFKPDKHTFVFVRFLDKKRSVAWVDGSIVEDYRANREHRATPPDARNPAPRLVNQKTKTAEQSRQRGIEEARLRRGYFVSLPPFFSFVCRIPIVTINLSEQ
jgi:hypothetical protein